MNLILAPYFTKRIGYHQHDSTNGGKGGSNPDDYELIAPWYESVKRLGLHARIFHNELSDGFVEALETDEIKFVYWGEEHRPSYNDERFYAYYSYLQNHDADMVFATDLYDVKFLRDPFEVIAGYHAEHAQWPLHSVPIDDHIFSGSEVLTKYSSKWMRRKCSEMDTSLPYSLYRPGELLYNAGIIGGRKKAVLKLMKCMLGEMNGIGKQFNANMPVYNLCIGRCGFVYSGYPLHNVFGSFKADPGTYIMHK